jgi:hypothetical protein
VRDDAEADGQQPHDDAQREPRRPRDVPLRQRPRRRDGDDGHDAERRRVGPREREVEQVRRDEPEAGQQQRALGARDAFAARATRTGL